MASDSEARLRAMISALPASLEGWRKAEDCEVYGPEDLYRYINGAAELYISFRFGKIRFGLAAVAALVHDVAFTMGAIGLFNWITLEAPELDLLGVGELRMNLPVVAALLTIIGYSLNDTIVVFDRIREVRGKSPRLTAEMINCSINQTLGRTLLTSLTTLLVVVVLYFGMGM